MRVFEGSMKKMVIFTTFTSRTPQQNGVVEKKIQSLQEIARTMLTMIQYQDTSGQTQLTLLVIYTKQNIHKTHLIKDFL